MAAYLSIHDVKQIRATSVWEPNNGTSPHITLDIGGSEFSARASITLYVKDHVLNDRLIEAINDVVECRAAELAGAP